MAGTRRSARRSQQEASPTKPQDESSPPKSARAGSKRKADAGKSPVAKRGKKAAAKKEQKTIEETLNAQDDDKETEATEDQPNDIEMKDDGADGEDNAKAAEKQEEDASNGETGMAEEQSDDKSKEKEKQQPGKSAEEEKPAQSDETLAEKPEEKSAADTKEEPAETATDESTKTSGAIVKSEERGKAMPRNVVEKGIIYFVTRSRVGVDEPEGPEDLQRTFLVMRPIPKDAKLDDGAIQDGSNVRYIALPKKVLPKSGVDKFMAFVDKAKTSIKDLKDGEFKGRNYETKTQGTRHTDSITPVGEGVYEITSTGRASHLLYMLTIPSELGEVQKDMGLQEKGSFQLSLKNPTRKGPAYASLGKDPEFPEEILSDFNGLAWIPVTKPAHLDYENAQLLLIGEKDKFAEAGESTTKDKKDETKETPIEELEKLEHEDELRIEHLDGDDSIFADLRLNYKEYSKVPTTW